MFEGPSRAGKYLSQAAMLRRLAQDTRYPEVSERLLLMAAGVNERSYRRDAGQHNNDLDRDSSPTRPSRVHNADVALFLLRIGPALSGQLGHGRRPAVR